MGDSLDRNAQGIVRNCLVPSGLLFPINLPDNDMIAKGLIEQFD